MPGVPRGVAHAQGLTQPTTAAPIHGRSSGPVLGRHRRTASAHGWNAPARPVGWLAESPAHLQGSLCNPATFDNVKNASYNQFDVQNASRLSPALAHCGGAHDPLTPHHGGDSHRLRSPSVRGYDQHVSVGRSLRGHAVHRDSAFHESPILIPVVGVLPGHGCRHDFPTMLDPLGGASIGGDLSRHHV